MDIENKTNIVFRKDKIIKKDGKIYIRKKDHNYWVKLWFVIMVAFLLGGFAYTDGKYAKQCKKDIQKTIDEISMVIYEYRLDYINQTPEEFNKILENLKNDNR